MVEAVSSSELACCSVRFDKSWLPAAIWLEALAIAWMPTSTSPTILPRLSFMSRRASSRCAVSSLPRTSITVVRSPAATVRATVTARARRPEMLRESDRPNSISTMESATVAPENHSTRGQNTAPTVSM
jgi:hypothetical protein